MGACQQVGSCVVVIGLHRTVRALERRFSASSTKTVPDVAGVGGLDPWGTRTCWSWIAQDAGVVVGCSGCSSGTRWLV
jgi:hypothetical protein